MGQKLEAINSINMIKDSLFSLSDKKLENLFE